MKKITSIAGITLISVLIIVPFAVWAHGWGMGGGHMMDYWSRGPGYYDWDDSGYTTLNREQQERLADLDRNYFNETRELRDKLWSKSDELNALLSEPNPDAVKAAKLQKEISGLRAELDEKTVNYKIEARRIAPDTRLSGRYGNGHMMDRYGMGYGPGACWK